MFAQVAKTGVHFSRNGPRMGARLLLSGPQRGLGMGFGEEFQDRQTVPNRLALPTLFDALARPRRFTSSRTSSSSNVDAASDPKARMSSSLRSPGIEIMAIALSGSSRLTKSAIDSMPAMLWQ